MCILCDVLQLVCWEVNALTVKIVMHKLLTPPVCLEHVHVHQESRCMNMMARVTATRHLLEKLLINQDPMAV